MKGCWDIYCFDIEEGERKRIAEEIDASGLPFLPNVVKAMADEGMRPADLYKQVDSDVRSVRKLLYGYSSAYNKNGEPEALAKDVADVLLVTVEDLFGPSPNAPENSCNNFYNYE